MLRSIKSLRGYHLRATDGEIGRVDDFLFDDVAWTVRYLVADTGGWLTGRLVLISPISLRPSEPQSKALPVDLTREQIVNSPNIMTDAPVSRQDEMNLAEHYGWPMYWGGPGMIGFGVLPIAPMSDTAPVVKAPRQEGQPTDPHLRSAQEVGGYKIRATDGEIGHIDDFILDDETWSIRYLVADTRNWLPRRAVLVAPDWVERVIWPDGDVRIRMSKDEMKNSPHYDPTTPINREYEGALYDYYGRRPIGAKRRAG